MEPKGPPSYDASGAGPEHHYGPTTVQPGVTVVGATMMPTVVASPSVGPQPTSMTCPSCKAQIVSRVEYISSTKTHIIAGILCCVGCCLCFIPYCMNSCKNAEHYCPNCSAYIGSYQR